MNILTSQNFPVFLPSLSSPAFLAFLLPNYYDLPSHSHFLDPHPPSAFPVVCEERVKAKKERFTSRITSCFSVEVSAMKQWFGITSQEVLFIIMIIIFFIICNFFTQYCYAFIHLHQFSCCDFTSWLTFYFFIIII